MSIRSMTGFGRATHSVQGMTLSVSLKSVNNKGLDLRVFAPHSWGALEPHIAKLIKSRLHRGRVDVHVDLGHHSAVDLFIDEEAFSAVCVRLQDLARKEGLAVPVRLEEVLAFRKSFELKRSYGATGELSWEDVRESFERALDRLMESREVEGGTIAKDLGAYRQLLSESVERIHKMRPTLLDDYRSRLKARLEEVVARQGVVHIEDARVAQEVILLADRCDIAEELQRAAAHLDRLLGLLNMVSPEPFGKKLDFYLQEMIRETNTMASKSHFAELTEVVVGMKSIIERMREQAANVE